MPFHHRDRHYPVYPGTAAQPDDIEAVDHAAQDRIAPDRRIKTDVCIVTSLTFPGGNTSSTIDEIQTFIDAGLSVSIVHCPVAAHMRRLSKPPTADKYEPFRDRVFEWYDIESIECAHLIARHPRVITSPCFKRLLGKIDAGHLWYVINNAQKHALGQDVYNPKALRRVVSSHLPDRTAVVPISPAIRSELMALLPDVRLSDADWHPTFDAELYRGEVADHLAHPVAIGRHARDSVDKWLEDPSGLSAAYPGSDKYIVRILGGAAVATDILGSLPSNWDVLPYGSITAQDYLVRIDIFVNFPHSNLREAFGRTVIEAIMHGRPAILPPSFEPNFGDLAYYCEPHAVETLIDRMVACWPDIRRLQKAAQDLVLERFASTAVKDRFPDLFAPPSVPPGTKPAGPPRFDGELSQLRSAFMADAGPGR